MMPTELFRLDKLPPHCGIEADVMGNVERPTTIRVRAVEKRWPRGGRWRTRVHAWHIYTMPTSGPIPLRWDELTT